MAKARLSVRKIKEVLRLKHACALSKRQIAEICKISHSTVGEYLERANKAGIGWPLPEGLTDQELEQRLFPPQPLLSGSSTSSLPFGSCFGSR